MPEDIKTIIKELEKIATPFTDELKKREMGEFAEQILDLIRTIEANPLLNCNSLYLLLQNELFDEIEKKGEEAGKSLMFLYDLMGRVSAEATLEMIAGDLKHPGK